ncbi:hypothetical protein D3C78_591000 [compost metagenome]
MHGIGLQQRLRGQATAVEVVVDGLAKVHAAGEHAQRQLDQRLPAQWRVTEAEEALVIEQAHAGFAECQRVEAFAVQTLQIGHSQVQPVVGQLLEDLFGTQGGQFEAQVGVFAVQLLHQRQRIETRQRHHPQAQRTDQVAATGCGLGLQPVIGGEHGARPGQHPLARRGEPLKALAAIDQWQIKLFFKAAQAHRQRGLGDVAARGRLAKVPGFVEGDEEFQLFDVHRRSSAQQARRGILARVRNGRHWSAGNHAAPSWSSLSRPDL